MTLIVSMTIICGLARNANSWALFTARETQEMEPTTCVLTSTAGDSDAC